MTEQCVQKAHQIIKSVIDKITDLYQKDLQCTDLQFTDLLIMDLPTGEIQVEDLQYNHKK